MQNALFGLNLNECRDPGYCDKGILVSRVLCHSLTYVTDVSSTSVLHRSQTPKKNFEHFPEILLKPGFGEHHPHTRRGAIQSSFCLRSPY